MPPAATVKACCMPKFPPMIPNKPNCCSAATATAAACSTACCPTAAGSPAAYSTSTTAPPKKNATAASPPKIGTPTFTAVSARPRLPNWRASTCLQTASTGLRARGCTRPRSSAPYSPTRMSACMKGNRCCRHNTAPRIGGWIRHSTPCLPTTSCTAPGQPRRNSRRLPPCRGSWYAAKPTLRPPPPTQAV